METFQKSSRMEVVERRRYRVLISRDETELAVGVGLDLAVEQAAQVVHHVFAMRVGGGLEHLPLRHEVAVEDLEVHDPPADGGFVLRSFPEIRELPGGVGFALP